MNMIFYDKETRDLLKSGIDELANVVKTTLGPCGSNVIIDREGIPSVTKDGVTVAKAVYSEDNTKNIGIKLIRAVSEKTGIEAGDGTTTSTVLTQAIINNVFNIIEQNKDLNLIYVKKGIDLAVKDIVEAIKEMSVPVEDKIEEIARISSNNDDEITRVVTEVMTKLGKDAMISLKPSDGNTEIKYSEGLLLQSGYMSPNFVTDSVKMEVELNDVYVSIHNTTIEKMATILPELELCNKHDTPILILCKDIDQDVLNTLVLNHINRTIRCCVVKIPGFNEYRQENIDDLKAVLGDNQLLEKVIINKTSTFVINKRGNTKTKADRVALLNHMLTLPDPNVEDIQKRIANINNSIATIFIGGNSEVEIKEKMDRYDDAICAVKSALEEGIVPGGGNTLHRVSRALDRGWEVYEYLSYPEIMGYNCMIDALSAPRFQILVNGGQVENGDFNKDLIFYKGDFLYIDDSSQYGIIDPTKVVRLSVENSASIAGTIITTNCIIL